jgi:nucleotide-binding universal stress UspA family protein
LLAGARRIPTTVIHFDYEHAAADGESSRQIKRTREVVEEGAEAGDEAGTQAPGGDAVQIATRSEEPDSAAIAAEARKGYGLLFVGREPASEGGAFHEQITDSAAEFSGPFAIAIARGIDRRDVTGTPLNILVAVTGTAVSRQGAEVAIALAQAAAGSLTALHVTRGTRDRTPRSFGNQLSARLAAPSRAEAATRQIVRLGDPYGVEVKGVVRTGEAAHQAILRQIAIGRHNLLVMGVNPRSGDHLFFGEVAAEMLARAECSLLFVASEPFTFETAATEENDRATSVAARAVAAGR